MNSKQVWTWVLRATVLWFFLSLGLLTVGWVSRVIPFELQSLLSSDHPVRVAYEKYLEKYDDGKSAFILVRSRAGVLETREIDQVSRKIGGFLKAQDGIVDVVAPHNAKYFSYSDYFHLRPFLREGQIPAEAREKLKTELWSKMVLSEDGKSFLVRFSFTSELPRKREFPLIQEMNQYARVVESEHPGVQIHSLGTKVASAAFLGEMGYQMKVITPALLILLGIFFFFLYRSWQILIWNFVIMLTAYVLTLILIISVEGGLGPYSNFALMFSFIVATTDLIHFFCRFQWVEGTIEERLQKAWKMAYVPCLLTSLTTAVGFIALIVNQNLPIRYFGIYCAFACLLEWVLIFYALPPVLRLFNFSAPVRVYDPGPALNRYFRTLALRSKWIVAVSAGIIILGTLFSFSLYVDDNFYTKFKSSHSLSQSVNAFSSQFNFVGSVDILIRPKIGKVIQREVVDTVRSFEKVIASDPVVSHLNSYRLIHDDLDQEIKKSLVGPGAAVASEDVRGAILDLLHNYGALSDFYSEAANEFRTVLFLRSLSTRDFNSVKDHIEKLKIQYADRLEVEMGGFAAVRSYINARVIRDFFESLFLSFLLTYLCFLYLYRNLKWALLALLPNALPLLVISGAMGLFGVPVDSNLAILICVAFGISGDNTLHLTYVVKQLKQQNASYLETLEKCIRQIGVPIVATSAVFLFCLPCFLLGHLRLFDHMAIFLSLAFGVAFYSDLFTFPAFHVLFNKKP